MLWSHIHSKVLTGFETSELRSRVLSSSAIHCDIGDGGVGVVEGDPENSVLPVEVLVRKRVEAFRRYM